MQGRYCCRLPLHDESISDATLLRLRLLVESSELLSLNVLKNSISVSLEFLSWIVCGLPIRTSRSTPRLLSSRKTLPNTEAFCLAFNMCTLHTQDNSSQR